MSFDTSSVWELIEKGENAYERSEFKKAIKFYEQGLAIARKIENRRGEGIVLGNLGSAYSALGEIRKAIEYYEQGLAIARKIENRDGEGVSLLNLGEANMVFGDWYKSLQLFNDALKIFKTYCSIKPLHLAC